MSKGEEGGLSADYRGGCGKRDSYGALGKDAVHTYVEATFYIEVLANAGSVANRKGAGFQ